MSWALRIAEIFANACSRTAVIRHVERHLLAPENLVAWSERPVRMLPIDAAVGVDHFWLEPDAKRHAEAVNVFDERIQAIRELASVNIPVRNGAGVVIARVEPAVVEHEALRAKARGVTRYVLEHFGLVVEVDRLPAIVVQGTRALRSWPGNDVVSDVTLERHRTSVQSGSGIGEIEGCRREFPARPRVDSRGVAELDLASPVRELFGHHAVAAGPAVVKRPCLALGVCRATCWHEESWKMLVAGSSRAVLAEADAWDPWRAVQLEFAAPTAGDVDHLVRVLCGRHDRSRQPEHADLACPI